MIVFKTRKAWAGPLKLFPFCSNFATLTFAPAE